MDETERKPWYSRVLPDFIAFAAGLAIAYYYRWETTDLVWSLWLCSLVLGYLTLLASLGGMGLGFYWGSRRPEAGPKEARQMLLVGGVIGSLLLIFFSFHFCGFHAGHSVFLQIFFPREGMPKDGFGAAFTNPPLLWFLTFKHLMVPYGIFLIPAIIAERKHVFRMLLEVTRAKHSPEHSVRLFATKSSAPGVKDKSNVMREFMGRPYLNVMRMHVLIFFFAIAHFAKLNSFLVYVVVYSAYFFPWSEIKPSRRVPNLDQSV